MQTLLRITVLLIVGAFVVQVVVNARRAVQRSRERQTLITVVTAAELLESGKSPGVVRDGWGHPLQITQGKVHYTIRAAGADGRFESYVPFGPTRTSSFASDIVVRDGALVQFPAGMCGVPDLHDGPLADCASCHPARIQTR